MLLGRCVALSCLGNVFDLEGCLTGLSGSAVYRISIVPGLKPQLAYIKTTLTFLLSLIIFGDSSPNLAYSLHKSGH